MLRQIKQFEQRHDYGSIAIKHRNKVCPSTWYFESKTCGPLKWMIVDILPCSRIIWQVKRDQWESLFWWQTCNEYFAAMGSAAGDFHTLCVSWVHFSSTADTDIMTIPEMRHKIDLCISECFLFHLHGGISILSNGHPVFVCVNIICCAGFFPLIKFH